MTKFITVVLSLVASTALYAQSPAAVRDQIFGETDAVKKQAEELNAKLLAPESYAEGMKVYLEAVDTMEKGKDLDRVREVQPWFHGDAVVILETGARLPLSRRFRANLLGAPVT